VKPPVTEKHVTEAVIGWLRAKGWMCVRQQSALLGESGKKVRIGTPGLPDWVCFKGLRYFFLELKRPGKKLSEDQKIWFALAQREKINAMWCDSFENFMAKFEIESWSVER
jgi:hypothetical protein